MVAASLPVSALGPLASARADVPPDPAARLQFIVDKIHIINDEDLIGGGEEKFFVNLCGDSGTSPYNRSFACGPGASSAFDAAFDLSSGDDVTLARVSPREGDHMAGGTTPEGGIPVYAGQHYIFTSDMFDRDPASAFDTMGDIWVHVDEAHNWGIGTHTVRSIQENGSPGDYELTFEIRKAPLPDLMNRGIRLLQTADGPFYCVTIQNVGEQPAAAVPLAVRADGALVRAPTLGPLDVGQTTEHCVLRSELPAGQHQLSFTVDEARQIPEMNESNNSYAWKIPALGATSAAPVATQSGSSAPGAQRGKG
jgi:CARDB protein